MSLAAITVKAKIALDQMPVENQAKVSEATKIENLDEWIGYRVVQSLAVAEGRLCLEAAMELHNWLGNSVEDFNNQPVEVRMIAFMTFRELIQ